MTSEANRFLVPDERPLTDREREVIQWLLDHCDRGNEFRDQIDRISVCSKCSCGCPTVDFAYNGVPVPRRGEMVISDHLAQMNGELFGVMLFQSNGKLCTLEVYSQTGLATSFELPATKELFEWEELSKHSPE